MCPDVIRVTIKERVVLHLADFVGYDDDIEVPHDLCQEGIAIALSVDRSQVTKALAELREMDFVTERLLHVEGSKRRRKAYCLTPPGFDYCRRLREHLLPKIVDFVDNEDRLIELPIGEIWQFMKHRVPFQRIITEAQKGSVSHAVLILPTPPVPGQEAEGAPQPTPTVATAPAPTPLLIPTLEPAERPPEEPLKEDIAKPHTIVEKPVIAEAKTKMEEKGPVVVEARARVETPKTRYEKELKKRVLEKEGVRKVAPEEGIEVVTTAELVEKGIRKEAEKGKLKRLDKIVLPPAPKPATEAKGAAPEPVGPPPDLMMLPDGTNPATYAYYQNPQYIQFYGPPDARLPVDIRARMRPKGYVLASGIVLLVLAAIFTLPMTGFDLPFCIASLVMAIVGGVLIVIHWEAMRAAGFEAMDTITRRGIMSLALGLAFVGTLQLPVIAGERPDFPNAAYCAVVLVSVALPLSLLVRLDRPLRAGLAVALGALMVMLFLSTSLVTGGERLGAYEVPPWMVTGIAVFIFGKELDEMPPLSTMRAAVPGVGISVAYIGILMAIGGSRSLLTYTAIGAWVGLGLLLASLPLVSVKRRGHVFDALGIGGGICAGMFLLILGIIMVLDGIFIGLIEFPIGAVVMIYGFKSMEGTSKVEKGVYAPVLVFLILIEVLTILVVLEDLRSLAAF